MTCRNCDHRYEDHPYEFFCERANCRCPGWVKKAAGT